MYSKALKFSPPRHLKISGDFIPTSSQRCWEKGAPAAEWRSIVCSNPSANSTPQSSWNSPTCSQASSAARRSIWRTLEWPNPASAPAPSMENAPRTAPTASVLSSRYLRRSHCSSTRANPGRTAPGSCTRTCRRRNCMDPEFAAWFC